VPPPAAIRAFSFRRPDVAIGRIFYQAAFGIQTRVNFRIAERAPLLLTAADKDQTVPLPMVRSNFKKYRRSSAVTAFKTFPNHSHWLIQEPGWQEIADYAIQWASTNDRTKAAEPTIRAASAARASRFPTEARPQRRERNDGNGFPRTADADVARRSFMRSRPSRLSRVSRRGHADRTRR
jgi:hypothetical protein